LKRFSFLAQALVLMLIVSACGEQSTPTISPDDQYSTAVAAAVTMLAETQAAIPTSTPLPSPTATETAIPSPTNTFVPLPTAGPTLTPNPAAGDPCINATLPDSLTGTKIKMRVDNPTKGAINLTVYLQSGNPQGVCGYRAYALAAGDSLVINDLVEGCYSLWAWNPDPNNYFMVTNGTSCLNSANNATFDITPNGIKVR